MKAKADSRVPMFILNVLAWEHPLVSAGALVSVNFLFWFVVSWNRRFISTLSLVALIVYLYKLWVTQIWPEIRVPIEDGEEDNEEWITVHPQVLSVPELSHYFDNFCNKLKTLYQDGVKLRQTSHSLFCILGVSACVLLAVLGHFVPGVVILYSIVLVLSLGPGITLHLIPATICDQFMGFFAEDSNSTNASRNADTTDSDLDEFLPETSTAVLRQLSLRSDSTTTDATAPKSPSVLSTCEEEDEERQLSLELGNSNGDSEESSLYAGLGAFPSVEEENESDIDDDIGLPDENKLPKFEEQSSNIQFVSTHYKEGSSESDSDAAFTEGLSFGPVVKEANEQAESVKLSKDSSEKNKEAAKVKHPSVDDSDGELDDFEILEETEIS